MKKTEIIETIIIIFSILAIWPLIWYYSSERFYKIPQTWITLYKVFLGILVIVLIVILIRRIKRVIKVMRDAKKRKNEEQEGKFPPFF